MTGELVNHLTSGINQNIIHTFQFSATYLLNYVCCFSGNQAVKGLRIRLPKFSTR